MAIQSSRASLQRGKSTMSFCVGCTTMNTAVTLHLGKQCQARTGSSNCLSGSVRMQSLGRNTHSLSSQTCSAAVSSAHQFHSRKRFGTAIMHWPERSFSAGLPGMLFGGGVVQLACTSNSDDSHTATCALRQHSNAVARHID